MTSEGLILVVKYLELKRRSSRILQKNSLKEMQPVPYIGALNMGTQQNNTQPAKNNKCYYFETEGKDGETRYIFFGKK